MEESLSGSVDHDNAAMDGIYNNGRQSVFDNGGVPVSGSFSRAADSKPRRRSIGRSSFPDSDDIITQLHGSDPVKVELNRLENEVRGKLHTHTHTHTRYYSKCFALPWCRTLVGPESVRMVSISFTAILHTYGELKARLQFPFPLCALRYCLKKITF
jgi:hypothetical protein